MRPFVALCLLAGCYAGTMGGGKNSRPGVMPLLSELPGDADKRDAILDQSNQTAGPEHRKGMTKKERKAETAAAAAAAILGSMFSSTKTVTLGTATVFGDSGSKPQLPSANAQDNDKAKPPPPLETDQPLVPWIRLTPGSAEVDAQPQ